MAKKRATKEQLEEAREEAIQLAYEQIHPDAIVVSLYRNLEISKAEAEKMVRQTAGDLAAAAIDGQTAICRKLWDIGFGKDSGRGVGTLTILAQQHCGWSKDGFDESVRKHMIAAVKAQFETQGLRAV